MTATTSYVKANEVPVKTFPVTRWHGPEREPEGEVA